MKVSELEGKKLDYWVARAEGENPAITPLPYSTSWRDAGPIIEREGIMLKPDGPRYAMNWLAARMTQFGDFGPEDDGWELGTTPLIAAMRAYVASKFGEDVPDETTA